jgi:hypothetical protein
MFVQLARAEVHFEYAKTQPPAVLVGLMHGSGMPDCQGSVSRVGREPTTQGRTRLKLIVFIYLEEEALSNERGVAVHCSSFPEASNSRACNRNRIANKLFTPVEERIQARKIWSENRFHLSSAIRLSVCF